MDETWLFPRLAEKAERVRWSFAQIPWQNIDRARVTPDLVDLVRDAAFSEMTTFSASQQFLKEFWEDPDFSQWVAVWFYEETRHPQVLLAWLQKAAGVHVTPDFFLRGRATAPFMKSRMGTLTTNIISEMVAAANYQNFAQACGEPVLAGITRGIAQDEARHASSFYAYAQRLLRASKQADQDRRDALKVIYMWTRDSDRVQHPVNEFLGRSQDLGEAQGLRLAVHKDLDAVRRRACRRIGQLLGLPLNGPETILEHLKA